MSVHTEAVFSAIAAEIAGLERLLVILHDEQTILTGAHIDRLADLLPRKSQLLIELENATNARQAVFQKIGITDHPDSINTWMASAGPELQAKWEALIALARQAAHFNRSNGQLIQNREEAQRIFLNSLTKTDDTAYTANGRVINRNNRRPFDQA